MKNNVQIAIRIILSMLFLVLFFQNCGKMESDVSEGLSEDIAKFGVVEEGSITDPSVRCNVIDSIEPALTAFVAGAHDDNRLTTSSADFDKVIVLKGSTIVLQARILISCGEVVQWFHNGEAIAGATARNVEIPNLQVSDSGEYSVELIREDGGRHFASFEIIVAETDFVSTPGVRGSGKTTHTYNLDFTGSTQSGDYRLDMRSEQPEFYYPQYNGSVQRGFFERTYFFSYGRLVNRLGEAPENFMSIPNCWIRDFVTNGHTDHWGPNDVHWRFQTQSVVCLKTEGDIQYMEIGKRSRNRNPNTTNSFQGIAWGDVQIHGRFPVRIN